jgi:hypothetical protein
LRRIRAAPLLPLAAGAAGPFTGSLLPTPIETAPFSSTATTSCSPLSRVILPSPPTEKRWRTPENCVVRWAKF